MAYYGWEFEDDIDDDWAKRHRTPPRREHTHLPINRYEIELASRRGRVALTGEEWHALQKFLNEHEKCNLKRDDYEHLPPKVRLVVHDWVTS